MNYLLEDIFRRADTWRGMDQHGMDQHGMAPSGVGQQNRAFLHPDTLAANGEKAANGETQAFSGIRTGFDIHP